jgi:hypothetical protein
MTTTKQVITSLLKEIACRGYGILEGTSHNPHLDPPIRKTMLQLRESGYTVEKKEVCYVEEHRQYYYCYVVKPPATLEELLSLAGNPRITL